MLRAGWFWRVWFKAFIAGSVDWRIEGGRGCVEYNILTIYSMANLFMKPWLHARWFWEGDHVFPLFAVHLCVTSRSIHTEDLPRSLLVGRDAVPVVMTGTAARMGAPLQVAHAWSTML